MNVSLLFLCGLMVTAAMSFGAVAYLQRPLRKLLVELCGNDDRAQFWTVFSNLTVAFVPLVAALQYQPSPTGTSPALIEIGAQLKWGLVGLVLSVLILGKILMKFIPRVGISTIPKTEAQPVS
ncbi:MAG TPA: hypothetical protein VH088_05335 [Terriglobales bacterium]|jgi:hypothetical protein|nr:hypothetical protein [Terriglobales bacterium]